jgi:hypothetical protein
MTFRVSVNSWNIPLSISYFSSEESASVSEHVSFV